MINQGSRSRLTFRALTSVLAALLVLAVLGGYASWSGRDRSPAQQVRDKLEAVGRVGIDLSEEGEPIVQLSLEGPRITDEIMELVGTLTELRGLMLQDTRVTDAGVRAIAHLRRLKTLDLDGVQITDEGLSALASLETLRSLSLRDTRVTERGFEYLRRLTKLRELSLQDMTIGHRAMTSLEGIDGLEYIRLNGVYIERADWERFHRVRPSIQVAVPKCGFGQQDRQVELANRRMRRNGFTGRLRLGWGSILRKPLQLQQGDVDAARNKAYMELLAVGQFKIDKSQPQNPRVVGVTLQGSKVTDKTMELLGALPELRSLALQDTRVTDSGMKQIGQLSDLRSLELDGVLLTDQGLMELSPLEHLVTLTIRDTPVTSDGLMRLRSHPNLRSTTVLTPQIDDDTRNERRSRRQGFTGRLRLAWRSLMQKDEPPFVCGTVLMPQPEDFRHPRMVAGGAAVR
jgi:internalin A